MRGPASSTRAIIRSQPSFIRRGLSLSPRGTTSICLGSPVDELDDGGERAFDWVKQILDGGPRVPLGFGSKMLCIVLGGDFEESETVEAGANVELTQKAFEVHFPPQKRRRPSSYFRSLALPVVSELMTRAALRRVTRSVVVGVPAGRVPRLGSEAIAEGTEPGFPAWSYGPKLVWIVPGMDIVRLFVRPAPEPWRRSWSDEIPVDGPLALPPELPPWAPEPHVFVSFDEPRACPHCQSPSLRYRRADDILICPKCARSFREKREHGCA
jgi:hypothetical protein